MTLAYQLVDDDDGLFLNPSSHCCRLQASQVLRQVQPYHLLALLCIVLANVSLVHGSGRMRAANGVQSAGTAICAPGGSFNAERKRDRLKPGSSKEM